MRYQRELREALREVRRETNLTLRELAEATGGTASTLSRFETGATNISGDILSAIEAFLGWKMKSDMEKFEEAEEQAAKDQRTAEIVALAREIYVQRGAFLDAARAQAIDSILLAEIFFQEVDEKKLKANGEI